VKNNFKHSKRNRIVLCRISISISIMQPSLPFVSDFCQSICFSTSFECIDLVPEDCSDRFYRIIEALFITHAQTKLNTLGHLDGMPVENKPVGLSRTEIMADRGEWCRDVIRRPAPSLHQTMTSTSYRTNPHFQ
jgi:hypothetical protein